MKLRSVSFIIAVTIWAVTIWFCALSTESGSARAQTDDDRPLRVGVQINTAPLAFIDGNGEPTGFAVELLGAIAREEGLKYILEPGPWKKVRAQFEAGTFDFLLAMSSSRSRAKTIEFSDPYFTAYDAIFTRNDKSIQSEADLKGKTILVADRGIAHDYFKEKKDFARLETASDSTEALLLLSAGQADAVLCPLILGIQTLHQLHIKNVSTTGRIRSYSRPVSFAVHKGHHTLLDRLNHGLSAIRASGEYNRLHEKWFGHWDPDYEKSRRWTVITYSIFSVCLLLLLLSLVTAGFFRRQVNSKARALIEKEQSYQQTLDAITDLIFVEDRNSNVVWANKALRQFQESTQSHGLEALDATSNDSLEGASRYFDTVRSPIFDSSGSHILTVGVSRDITEQLEQERLISEQRAKIVASAKLSALGEMAGGIAHEINNPLGVILTWADHLKSLADKGTCTPDKVRTGTGKIIATTQRISKIIRSLRSIARESTHDSFQIVPISQVIDDTLEICRERFRMTGIHLSVSDIPDSLMIECRPIELSQVLLNLLNNAYDALEGNAVPNIDISIRDENENIRISVCDNGPGIPFEVRDQIFAPFFTTKPVGKGTGIGLSISRGIVESHHGTLILEDRYEGTEFSVILPKKQPIYPLAAPEREEPSPAMSKA